MIQKVTFLSCYKDKFTWWVIDAEVSGLEDTGACTIIVA